MCVSTKCRKCRHLLLEEREIAVLFINAHSGVFNNSCLDDCPSLDELICLTEEHLPEWIKVSVEEKNWSKGKINCKHCGARIGSFDFISGTKCACKSYVLPAVHINKSKVDLQRGAI